MAARCCQRSLVSSASAKHWQGLPLGVGHGPFLPLYRRNSVTRCSMDKFSQTRSQSAQMQRRNSPQRARPTAGCSAVLAAVLTPLLPSWALDSFATMTDTSIDPGLGESPPLLDTLLVVVVTYFTVMLLYLWLSSFLAGEDEPPVDDSSKSSSSGGDSSELPPGYGSFLNAHVRTYVTPGTKQVSALQDLGQAEPLEGEDLAHLKNRLAAGAAEAVEQQLRDCERLVRSKLLARKLGYRPSHTQKDGSSSSGSGSSGRLESSSQIEEMMLTAVLTAPEGLSSWQHRAAMEALIDQQLDDLLPPGGGAYQEDLIVRQVMRRVVAALVREESLLLLEGTGQAQKKLGQAGKGDNPWALW